MGPGPLLALLAAAAALAAAPSSRAFHLEAQPDGHYAKLRCPSSARPLSHLSDHCALLRLYNESEALRLASQAQLEPLAERCACELFSMQQPWLAFLYEDSAFERIAQLVTNKLDEQRQLSHNNNNNNNNNTLRQPPDYLWTNMDVIVYKFSIYTAASDYFEQQAHNKSKQLEPKTRLALERDELWRRIRRVCRVIANDSRRLYRYLENLNRLDSGTFVKLTFMSQPIEVIYQASKACKLLIYSRLHEYKLRPDDPGLVAVDTALTGTLTGSAADMLPAGQLAYQRDNLVPGELDEALTHDSVQLLDCGQWHNNRRHVANNTQMLLQPQQLDDFKRECPLMLDDRVPLDWARQHAANSLASSLVALKCACKLLAHNQAWAQLLQDPNVAVMSQALVNFINRQVLPDFGTTPMWALRAWFDGLMARFRKNRKLAIKEVIKTSIGDPDPSRPINRTTRDEPMALELLRRGCNYIVYNHSKGQSKQAVELRLVRYLDNLQLISQDPTFVFHLTLQDPNLFKIYALSKMCEPFVR